MTEREWLDGLRQSGAADAVRHRLHRQLADRMAFDFVWHDISLAKLEAIAAILDGPEPDPGLAPEQRFNTPELQAMLPVAHPSKDD